MSESVRKEGLNPDRQPRISLSWKINIMVIGILLMLTVGILGVSYLNYVRRMDMNYQKRAVSAAKIILESLDVKNCSYFADMISTDEFYQIRKEAEASGNYDLLLEWMKEKPSYSVFKSGGDPSKIHPASNGRLTLFDDYEFIRKTTTMVLSGEAISRVEIDFVKNGDVYGLYDSASGLKELGIDPYAVSPTSGLDRDNQYGWEMCGFEYLEDPDSPTDDNLMASAYARMNEIVSERAWFLINTAVLIAALVGIAILVSLYFSRKYIIDPLERLSNETAGFITEAGTYNREALLDMVAPSNDEISDLYTSVRNMQEKIIDSTEVIEKNAAEKERIHTEMRLGATLQASVMPELTEEFTKRSEFDVFGFMKPAREVSGDFYDFFFVDDDHLGLVIADVSGKGIPAALFMMITKALLRDEAMSEESPADIFAGVNHQFQMINKTLMFVTVWIGIINLKTGVMKCANAGHEKPAIQRNGRNFMLFPDPHSLVLSGLMNTEYKEYEIEMKPGDMILVYTDGVTEAQDRNKNLYTERRMLKALNQGAADGPKETIDHLYEDICAFTDGNEQFDDITMLAFRYRGDRNEAEMI